MLRIAVCDDEPETADALSLLISACLEEKGIAGCRIKIFSEGRALLESGLNYDLIFLDIRLDGGENAPMPHPAAGAAPDLPGPLALPGASLSGDPAARPAPDDAAPLTGMQTARLLRGQGSRSLLIFVTVLPEYVFDAFAVEAFDYLVKPVDPARLARTMDRALRTLSRRAQQSLVIRRAGGCEVIPLSALAYCEVQGRKVYFHRTDGTVAACYDRLRDLEQRLDGRFFQCHRSYLVNLDEVRGCADGLITLRQGEKVPVSRLRGQELAAALLRRMKERED